VRETVGIVSSVNELDVWGLMVRQPDHFRGPRNLICNENRASFPWGKAAGAWQ